MSILHNARSRAGHTLRSQRRGTFIVLVVGMLALMTILAVVYFSIGQSDARSSAAMVTASKRDDVAIAVRDHIKTILADDVTASIDPGSGAIDRVQRYQREAWDYPWTSPVWRTVSATPALRFNPIGTRGDDPFLASSEPTILGTGRTWSDEPLHFSYRSRRDWMHFSNIAPDGNYVNLYNLRPSSAGGPSSGGFGATPTEMRRFVSLFDQNGNPGYARLDDDTTALDPEVPAHLSYRQRNAFRPLYDDRPYNDRDYIPYSYADADGDGFVDSRWQELVNASNPTAAPTDLIRAADGRRYFVAARVVDLSGRINVNTATDFVNAPSNDSPAGMSPADVDLRSILTMQDSYEVYATAFGSPIGSHGTGDYRVWNPTDTTSVENYSALNSDFAYQVGIGGYNALRLSLETSIVPPPRTNLTTFATQYLGDGATGNRVMPNGLEREKSFLASGSGSTGATLLLDGLAFSGGFGLSDLTELLTYRVANDPEQVSILESALGGRFPEAGADAAGTRRYGPLRDNRQLSFEIPGATLLPSDAGKLDATRLLFATDIRQRLTTHSGARPIRPAPTNAFLLQTNSADSRYDFSTNVVSLIRNRNAARLFRGYADALAPFSAISGVWNRTASDFAQTRFLAYGYNGPELPVRLAAHSAINLLAATGRDGTVDTREFEPYPYTLILHEGARTQLNADSGLPVAGRTFRQGWWQPIERQLDLTSTRIAPTGTVSPTHAVTMYGIKPQPVITQASAYTIYIDAPQVLGGDADIGASDGGVPPVIEVRPITINGDTNWGNSDYLGRILAIQLTNPFKDVDIPLSRDDVITDGTSLSPTDVLYTYYIEFGGRTYKLVAIDPTDLSAPQKAVVLRRGETRNFVILDAEYSTFNARWNAVYSRYASGPIDPVASPFRNWLNSQLSVENTTGVVQPVIIPAMNATSGALASAGEIFAGTESQHRSIRLWRAMISGATDDNLTASSGANNRENDYLVDRLRDPAGSGVSLKRDLPPGQNDIGGTIGREESFSSSLPAGNDNTGFTIALRASIRRPDEGTVGDTGIPAYVIESKTNSRNSRTSDSLSTASLNKSDFTPNTNGAYQRFTTFITGTTGTPPSDILLATARQRAGVKSGSGIGPNLSSVAFNNLVVEFPRSLRNRVNNGTLRLADLYLPLAIGPFVEMDETGAATLNDASAATDRFYTLGEALALALDYDRGPAGSPMEGLGNPLRNPGIADPRPALARGHLVLDDYVLFRNGGGALRFDYPTAGEPQDVLYGSGAPAALSLMDIFHTMDDRYRSERVATTGLININTAPVEVLRAARLLSPFDQRSSDWWFTPASQHNRTSDIASTLVAYRDKIPVHPRRGAGFNVASILDFTDLNDGTDTLNYEGDNNGRFFTTDVPGLRETPGIRSLGELFLLRDTRPTNPERTLHSIDRLGFDTQHLTAPGMDTETGSSGDGLIDDFGERLAIVNGVANLFTVRSDYFAVWFVLHGYAESDLASLKPTDPLVPSVARRFLMIVDRSSVTVRGDEPQILLFKEVPY
ncbi:MAG: hypothetical protein KF902_05590 [Phycisphaeraceae bacterium]|nr:hypothetical protein [Phycisphaeraceae bacterium]